MDDKRIYKTKCHRVRSSTAANGLDSGIPPAGESGSLFISAVISTCLIFLIALMLLLFALKYEQLYILLPLFLCFTIMCNF